MFRNIIAVLLICMKFENISSEALKRSRRGVNNSSPSCNYTYVPSGNSGCDQCGNVNYAENVRIVGGVPATAYSWPAQVLIIETISGTYKIGLSYYSITKSYMCGGTLLNRYTVLTAAHCIQTEFTTVVNGASYTIKVDNPYDSKQFAVYIGAYDITFLDNGGTPSLPTVKKNVYNIIRHPNFDSNSLLNDIAILHLSREATFNQYIQPACLPNPSYGSYPSSVNSSSVYASGWGTLTESGSQPNKLYNVLLNSYPSSYCANVEASYEKNWNAQICAGLYSGGKDTCQGDSGGGLYIFDSKISKFVVIGVTSYGYGCANKFYPGIYTRTSFYYDWIQANMALTGYAVPRITINCFLIYFSVLILTFLKI